MSSTRLNALHPLHRVWFLVVCVAHLGFLFLIPPFQTNDEPAHWERAWTVARGQVRCRDIPVTAHDLIVMTDYWRVRDQNAPYTATTAMDALSMRGRRGMMEPGGAACLYAPISYLAPAAALSLLSRPYDTHRSSRMLHAFYGARLMNWLLMSAAVLVFLIFSTRFRNLALVAYSLPMSMQQATSINQESMICVCGVAMLLLWWSRPSTMKVAAMGVAIMALAWMKPVFLVLYLWWLCAWWRLRKPALLAIPVLAVALLAWWQRGAGDIMRFLPSGVNPKEQVRYLMGHPFHLLEIWYYQFLDLFGRGHMNGGWTGILGVLGWAEIEIGDAAYAALFAAIGLAIVADLLGARDDAADRPGSFLGTAVPIVSLLSLLPAFSLSQYLVFNAVGSKYALGTQGRYWHFPFLLTLMLALDRVAPWLARFRSERKALAVGATAMVLCFVAIGMSLLAIHHKFRAFS